MSLPGGGEFEIKTREYSIGRGASNDLPINAEGVSKVHATIKWLNHQFVITDQRSTNHTTVDGERLPPLEPKPLDPDREYTVTLGQRTRLLFSYHMGSPTQELKTEVEAAANPAPYGEKSATVADEALPRNVQAEIELTNQVGDTLGRQTITAPDVTIGRRKTNTLPFENAEISRLHAHLFWRENHFYLEDLDSGNGTFLDGYRLTRFEPVELAQGTTYHIRLGRESMAVRFRFRYTAKPLPQVHGADDEPTHIPEE
jgi:pSer/pThr/pTyr-binding forkhead associated (FHA) protein